MLILEFPCLVKFYTPAIRILPPDESFRFAKRGGTTARTSVRR